MMNAKFLAFIQILALLSRSVVSQEATLAPNASLYIPLDSEIIGGNPNEVIIASVITVSGPSTIYKLVDLDPTPDGTFTLALSPTGANLVLIESDDIQEVIANVTCNLELSKDVSNCEFVFFDDVLNGTTTVSTGVTSTFQEAIQSVSVILFDSPASTTSSPQKTSTTTSSGKMTTSSPAGKTPTTSSPSQTSTTSSPGKTPTISPPGTPTTTTSPATTPGNSPTTSPPGNIPTTTTTTSPSTGSPTNTNAPKNAAVASHSYSSFGFVTLFILCVVFELM